MRGYYENNKSGSTKSMLTSTRQLLGNAHTMPSFSGFPVHIILHALSLLVVVS